MTDDELKTPKLPDGSMIGPVATAIYAQGCTILQQNAGYMIANMRGEGCTPEEVAAVFTALAPWFVGQVAAGIISGPIENGGVIPSPEELEADVRARINERVTGMVRQVHADALIYVERVAAPSAGNPN